MSGLAPAGRTSAGLLVEKGVFTKGEFLEKVSVVDQGIKTKNERRVAPKQNGKAKSVEHDED
jgi:hypothetical protein